MDDFRREQKKFCKMAGNSLGGKNKYGCGCCRKIPDLRKFRKYSRRWAKSAFRRMTKIEIANQLQESYV